MIVGGIEAGGTKIVFGVAELENGQVRILDRRQMPTETADVSIPKLARYFSDKDIESLGIASFGPLDLRKESPTYGYVKATPKKGWEETDFVRPFADGLRVPVNFDTDVNGAVLGEVCHGAAKGCDSALYMTVGTGIGAGIWMNGGLVHGLVHPEAGHMLVLPHPKDVYKGSCRFHCDEDGRSCCLEGLASGPAISGRWGRPGNELAERPEVWELEVFYLAQGISNLVFSVSPEKIILGGGVMHQASLFPLIRKRVKELLGGYIRCEELFSSMEEYIVPPLLGDDAGLIGAFELARQVWSRQ